MSQIGKCRYPKIDIIKTGENIKKLREKAGISVSDLAKIIGVTVTAIYKWQLGISLPNVDNVVLMSHLFNVSMDDIIIKG